MGFSKAMPQAFRVTLLLTLRVNIRGFFTLSLSRLPLKSDTKSFWHGFTARNFKKQKYFYKKTISWHLRK